MDGPLVSVIMNCFNGEQYLQEAIDSVLCQTYSNWELIFWDNQSTDSSAEVLKGYSDKRVQYFRAPKHTKLYEARNMAIAESSGQLIAFLDVDDLWLPRKLEQQVPLFNEEKVGFVYGNQLFLNANRKTIRLRYRKDLPSGNILVNHFENYVVGLVTLIIRKEYLAEESAPFDARLHMIGDFDLVVRLSESHEARSIQNPVAVTRWHRNNETIKNNQLNLDELILWLTEAREQNRSIVDILSFSDFENNILFQWAVRCAIRGERQAARKVFHDLPISARKFKLLVTLLVPKLVSRMSRFQYNGVGNM
jgi:glycosyltransferase involved in cell wall biosynthesis